VSAGLPGEEKPRADKPHGLAGGVVLHNELNLTRHGNLDTLGATKERGAELVDLYLEVTGHRRQNGNVPARGGNLERLHALRALFHVDELAGLYPKRRAIDQLAVNQNVTVHNHLTRLRRRTGDAGTNNQSVETHLEELDQVLTGQSLGTASFLEDAFELSLANAVLSTEALLLAKTHGVVRVGLALSAPVLTRRIGTFFEVLSSLGREGNAQSTREAGLAAGT